MKGALALRKPVQTLALSLAGTNILTASWTQVITALSFGVSALEIFNPSNSPILISQGSPGNEVAGQIPYTTPPGGQSPYLAVELKAGQPITLKALDANITTGRLILNFYA